MNKEIELNSQKKVFIWFWFRFDCEFWGLSKDMITWKPIQL